MLQTTSNNNAIVQLATTCAPTLVKSTGHTRQRGACDPIKSTNAPFLWMGSHFMKGMQKPMEFEPAIPSDPRRDATKNRTWQEMKMKDAMEQCFG